MSNLDAKAVHCVLCDSDSVSVIDRLSFRELRQLYFETCEVDISRCLDRPYENPDVDLYRCTECGLEFYPSSLKGSARLYEALARFDYYYMDDKWEFRVALEDIKDSQSVLEVGCGTGFFLDQIARAYRGTTLMGLELNRDALEISRQNGLFVQAKSIEQFSGEHACSFDVVCALQVLEHVSNPHSFLEAAFRCLKRGGLCVLTVPNALGFTQYAVNDFGNMPPHHLTRWTTGVMQKIAVRHSVSLERIVLEPVARYHKEWYRDTLTVRTVSKILGLRWNRIELGTRYRIVLGLCRRLSRMIPSSLWKYSYPGHTLYVSFRKP